MCITYQYQISDCFLLVNYFFFWKGKITQNLKVLDIKL